MALALVTAPPQAAEAQRVPDVGALATSVSVEVQPPSGPLFPLGPFAVLPVTVTYTVLEAAPELDETEVTLTVAGPEWATLAIHPEVLRFAVGASPPCGCERIRVQEAEVLVNAGAAAPAFHPGEVTVRANAKANGAYAASEGQGSAGVMADFRGSIQAAARSDHLTAPRAEGTITVANLGNGLTKVHVEMDAAPAGLRFRSPPPVTLEPGGSQEMVVHFDPPVGTGRVEVLVGLTGTYALSPSAGAPDHTQVRFTMEGADPLAHFLGGASPAAFAAALVLLGVVGGVAFLRLRRASG